MMLLTKSDLYEVLGDFDPQCATRALRNLANAAPVIEISSRAGGGMPKWTMWLQERLAHCHKPNATVAGISG